MSGQNRKKQLESIMENFQIIHRNIISPRLFGTASHMTASQWMALRHIGSMKGTGVKDLSQLLGITSSAATQLVDGLVRGGYVIRKGSTTDRRQVTLHLSKTTAHKITIIKKHILSQLVAVFKVLSDTEFETYLTLNKKIVSSFKK